jgi:two-component system CheB/CheR fusion protein
MHDGVRDRYFTAIGERYIFRSNLRGPLIFGSHDILHDPPFRRLDLILCRNTLMYFNAAAQARVIRLFHRALNPNAHLLLGEAESAWDRGLFTKDHGQLRLYSRVASFAGHAGVAFQPTARYDCAADRRE